MGMKKYLVYRHRNRCTKDVFYVGVGDRGRAYDETNRSKEWKEKMNECYFDVEIVAKNLPRDLAFKIEKAVIESYGFNNLVNKTKGGVGSLGMKHTKESKLKIAEAARSRVKTEEEIKKGIQTRIDRHSKTYKHIETGKIFKGLKIACEHFNIKYRAEHQRQSRNSFNKNFEMID